MEIPAAPEKWEAMKHLEIATGELAVREDKSSNEDSNGRIAEYRASVRDSRYTMKPGDAYCAAFVSWCLEQADNPILHDHGSGISYVPWLWDWLYHHDMWFLYSEAEPEPGDLILFSLGGERPDHVGFVLEVGDQRSDLQTIEGNVGGHPNGGVKKMRRKINERILGFGALNK